MSEVVQADRDMASEWEGVVNHRHSEFEGDVMAELAAAFARHRQASTDDLVEALRLARDLLADMFRDGKLFTPASDEEAQGSYRVAPYGSYYVGPGVMEKITSALTKAGAL